MHLPRTLLLSGAALAATLLNAAPAALAEAPYARINSAAATSPVTATRLRGSVAMVEGSGGNITVLSRPGGQFLVDGGIAVSKAKIQALLASLGPGPVRDVVNTHWHWDHTDGDGWLRARGATVIAHPQTIRRLAEEIRVDEWEHTFEPVPAADRPDRPLARPTTLKFGGERIVIRPYPHSHTDGDLSVYFPAEDVLATGDTFWNGLYPFIDYHTGGGIDGMIQAANTNIARAGPKTLVVPGHGPVGRRADLVAYRDLLVAARAKVAALKARGMTLDEVIAAKPTAAFDTKWGQEIISPTLFTALVYQGV
jgi:glyoxylase-like metal-dependent hydrolase (beta-lactamase superfamily II)